MIEKHRTKGERRETKRRKKRNMRVVGRSIQLLQKIIGRRAEKSRNTKNNSQFRA